MDFYGLYFCKIINKEIPAKVAYEDDNVVAFHDINPQAPIHLLIVPKKHITSVMEIDDEENLLLGDIILTAQKSSQGE